MSVWWMWLATLLLIAFVVGLIVASGLGRLGTNRHADRLVRRFLPVGVLAAAAWLIGTISAEGRLIVKAVTVASMTSLAAVCLAAAKVIRRSEQLDHLLSSSSKTTT
ncbi:hypothetical protein ACQP2U_42445 (plasmid) [Nocardia sp. CA-084685]|uniref:hypothetical protein n=1 Tax=Nocardia sp. CA-084685 TaxID=3239970 RepID=UPI003D986236